MRNWAAWKELALALGAFGTGCGQGPEGQSCGAGPWDPRAGPREQIPSHMFSVCAVHCVTAVHLPGW